MKRIARAALFVIAGIGRASAQDAATGEKVFAVCKACHQVGDNAKNAVGPVLNGLFERKAAWDEATFTEYIKDPKAKIPGTKMVFAGIKDEKKIKDLIAYLHTFDKAPVKLAQ
jgi:cytochrome c